ncbi:nucleotidyltransferase family protein [Carboxylicivirga litoralis]|uniref:nucleotidyltransferase family protein n=1 Tax=Carboxylicivirga litoralis TaxID=2816963 RepID=UPI0021CB4B35|nr:sugar phosphate nucleotidyltransferase [Carboxylicivirga sp. A043]
MIFAAGLGTRLKPLTKTMPKAMAPFNGKPLLWHAIKNMEAIGAERIVVNVHHFASQVINYINSNTWKADVVISDESDQLLDTGGGLLKAQSLFIPNKSIFIRNVDIITSTNLESFIYSHRSNQNDATLMVKKRSTSRYLSFDNTMQLCAWKNIKTHEEIIVKDVERSTDLAFSGMHIIEPHLLEKLGDVRPFSIIHAYLELAKAHQIKGFQVAEDELWYDVGTLEKLQEAEINYKSGT